MSPSLRFECDPVDQPVATDPVEQRTWCALGIRVGQRYASRLWDKSLQQERRLLYVPAFPIAGWLVQHWWSLFNELCPADEVPQRATATQWNRRWLSRHCLRSADSSLLLPALYVFHDGRGLRAEWFKDEAGSLPNMPGEFAEEGCERLDVRATEDSLAVFINDTLARLDGLDDSRVDQLARRWRAIQAADAEETAFCRIAGRMGIDPYDPQEMTSDLAAFIEQEDFNPDDPLVVDVTEVADAASIAQQWTWVVTAREELRLGPGGCQPSPVRLPATAMPHQFGYQLARQVRPLAQLGASEPLASVPATAERLLHAPFRIEDRNHLPGRRIQGLVGRSTSGGWVAAGLRRTRDDNERFRLARCLYHALATSQVSPRLLTSAVSWDQQASRAFAAELLAPQSALAERVDVDTADVEAVGRLSEEFAVSSIVIQRQLENLGIPLSCE